MSGFLNNAQRDIFRLGYEISPIILTGGAAGSIPGGMLPIVAITEALNIVDGLLNGTVESSLDNFFAHFKPLPGSTLINNQIGQYPFANQAIAANAIITQPLTVSMLMLCPVRQAGGYTTKLATIMALQATLAAHINQGGLFTVVTPGYVYTNLILASLRDVSDSGDKQAATAYQWDFEQPLITIDQAQSVQNSFLSKMTAGAVTDGSQSGVGVGIGNVVSGFTSNLVSSASNLVGSAVKGAGAFIGGLV